MDRIEILAAIEQLILTFHEKETEASNKASHYYDVNKAKPSKESFAEYHSYTGLAEGLNRARVELECLVAQANNSSL